MCMCVSVCVSVCICICFCIVCLCSSVCLCACVCVWLCAYVYVSICVWACVYMLVCVYMGAYVCAYMCVYMCVYVYTHANSQKVPMPPMVTDFRGQRPGLLAATDEHLLQSWSNSHSGSACFEQPYIGRWPIVPWNRNYYNESDYFCLDNFLGQHKVILLNICHSIIKTWMQFSKTFNELERMMSPLTPSNPHSSHTPNLYNF